MIRFSAQRDDHERDFSHAQWSWPWSRTKVPTWSWMITNGKNYDSWGSWIRSLAMIESIIVSVRIRSFRSGQEGSSDLIVIWGLCLNQIILVTIRREIWNRIICFWKPDNRETIIQWWIAKTDLMLHILQERLHGVKLEHSNFGRFMRISYAHPRSRAWRSGAFPLQYLGCRTICEA